MIVNATDIKNNFGKYIKILDKEEILVTKNGSPVAKIIKQKDWKFDERVCEKAMVYGDVNTKMSYEDFIVMNQNSENRYEYIDGEIYLQASPKITHQRTIGNLYIVLHSWFQGKKCTPYLSPFDVTLKKSQENVNVVQPDLLVLCDPENKDDKDKYTGIPTLVIEVISESSARMDLIKKLDLYMQTGIREYWIVNYFSKEVSVYWFVNKDIKEIRNFTEESIVKSFVFEGLQMKLTEIF